MQPFSYVSVLYSTKPNPMASLTEITGVLGRKRAAHLLRRSTFGPTIAEIDQFSALTATQAMALLLDDSAVDPLPPIDLETGSTWVDPTNVSGPPFAGSGNSEQDQLFEYFKAWHIDVMRKAPLTLKERLTWFLHTHLPARWTEIKQSEAIYYQNCLYRHYAYGSFKELFKKICVDNAMLRYLDGYSNKKNSPNENFAREMFELYSIGRGEQVLEGDYTNYTEEDIKAATRVLTGWGLDETYSYIDPDTGLPAGKMESQMAGDGTTELATEHDTDDKTFTDKFGSTVISSSEVEGFSTVEAAYGELDEMIEEIINIGEDSNPSLKISEISIRTNKKSLLMAGGNFLPSVNLQYSNNWSKYDFQDFPSVKWKLLNLEKFRKDNPNVYGQQLAELEDVLM